MESSYHADELFLGNSEFCFRTIETIIELLDLLVGKEEAHIIFQPSLEQLNWDVAVISGVKLLPDIQAELQWLVVWVRQVRWRLTKEGNAFY